MAIYSSHQKFLLFLLMILGVCGNVALYHSSQISSFPDLESFPERFVFADSAKRFRAFKDYGYVRSTFSPQDIERLDRLLIQKLEPTHSEFETDETIRFFLYHLVWYPYVSSQKTPIDFSKILSDSSHECRKFGVEKMLQRNAGNPSEYLPYFLKETNESVLSLYLFRFNQFKEPLPAEIAPAIIQIASKYRILNKISVDLLIRLITREKHLEVLKEIFTLFDHSDPQIASLGKQIFQKFDREELSWVPPETAREIIQKKTFQNFSYLIWLFKPELFEKQEFEQILFSFWKESYEKKVQEDVIENLFEISLVYDLDSSTFHPFMKKIVEDSGRLDFQLYFALVRNQQASSDFLLEEIRQIIYKMPQVKELATRLSRLAKVQKDGWAILMIYHLQNPNFEYHGTTSPNTLFSPSILEMLFNECLLKIRKKTTYSPTDYLKILKDIAPHLKENQINRLLQLFDEIYSTAYIDEFLGILENLSGTLVEVHQHLITLLPPISELTEINRICDLLSKYCVTSEMYENSKKAIQQKMSGSGGRRGQGRREYLKRYLRALEDNFDKNHPYLVRFTLKVEEQQSLNNGIFPKLSDKLKQQIEEKIGSFSDEVTLEILNESEWKIILKEKTLFLKQREDQFRLYLNLPQ